MTYENKVILINRIKSFLWRLGSMAAVAVIAFILENMGLLDLPIWVQGILTLVGGELTKYLNTPKS